MGTTFTYWFGVTAGVLTAVGILSALVAFVVAPHSRMGHAIRRMLGEPSTKLLPNTTEPKIFITAAHTGLTAHQRDELFEEVDRVIGFVVAGGIHQDTLEHTWVPVPTATQQRSFCWCLTLSRPSRTRLETHLATIAQDMAVTITVHEAAPARIHPPRPATPTASKRPKPHV